MARVPQIRPTQAISSVASNPGPAGQGFAGLAAMARIGADIVRPAAVEESQARGAKRVFRDEKGQLKIDPASPYGGEMAEVQNAAAYASYLSQRKIDMRENFTELGAKYEFNPDGFKTAADAYVNDLAAEEGVPELLRQDILITAKNEASQRFQGLFVQQNNRVQRDADRNTAAQRDMLTDDYINLVMAGDTEGANAVYEEMQGVTAFRGSAPFIAETEVEGQAFLEGARGAARAAQLTRRLEDLSGARSISDEERAEIQGLIDDPDITPQVRMRLYSATQGRLKAIDGRAAADALAGTTTADAVRNYDTGRGISRSYYDSIESAESGGDPNAKNPNSSATGLFQFTTGTWQDMMRNHPDLGLTEGGRTDPAQQRRAIVRFTEDNARILARNGLTNSNGNLYAAHFLGAGDAVEVLNGRPDQLVSDFVSSGVLDANPFLRGMTVADFSSWASRKGGGSGRARARVDTDANRSALAEGGVPLSPGSEFFAGAFSVDAASVLYGADATAAAADVLPEDVLAANPRLADMTIGQARAWAERQGTVKSSDIAARRGEIDQIEDEEVRSIALSALNEHYNQRRRIEQEAEIEYEARIAQGDVGLTEDQIRSDHGLSDQAQTALVDELRAARKDQIAVQETISDLANPQHVWDIFDSSQRGRLDDAYGNLIGEENPLSATGMSAAAEITLRAGVVPKRAFNAVRAAAASNDPAALAAAMEFSGQILDRQPGAFAPHDGSRGVLNTLDDFRFYSGFMDAETAAARIIENNLPENRARTRNLSDLAKDAAKNLKPDDVLGHMSSLGVDVSLGNEAQQAAIMGSYDRLFREAFIATGDEDLAKNRALAQMSRVYGPNEVTGDNRLMRFPPQAMYPRVPGRDNWMQEQIERDVSEFVYGDDANGATLPDPRFQLLSRLLGEDHGRVKSDRIILSSDEFTARDVASGRKPTYSVSYLDENDMLQSIPGRYQFEPPEPVESQMDVPGLTAQRTEEQERTNVRLWHEHFRNDPNRSMSLRDINQELLANMDRYKAAPPPTE